MNFDISKPILVYRNLHRGLLSVKQKTVRDYCEKIVLNGVSFKVSEAGRQRVIREQKKNVHAYVRGFFVSYNTDEYLLDTSFKRIFYNPYLFPYFHDEHGQQILTAEMIALICLDDPSTVLMLAKT